MRKEVKRNSVTLVLLLLASSVFATGGGDKADGVATSDRPVTLRVFSYIQPENPEGLIETDIASAYKKLHPNVTIEFVSSTSNEQVRKITALAAGNDMTEVFYMGGTSAPTIIDLDLADDMRKYFDADFIRKFQVDMLSEGTAPDGKLLFIPLQGMPTGFLYRADWFAEKGLNPPETWDDVVKAGQVLTEDTDGDGKIDRYGYALIATKDSNAGSRFMVFMNTFGCQNLYIENGKWKTDVGNDAFKKAVQAFVDFDSKYHIVQPGALETSYPEAANLFVANKAAMMLTGVNALGTIYAQNPDLKGKLGSVRVPRGTRHISNIRPTGYGLYKDSKVKDIAIDYIKFFCQDENLLQWVSRAYRTPPVTNLNDNPALRGIDIKGFLEASQKDAFPLPQFPGITKAYEIVAVVFQSLLMGQGDIDTLSAQAKKEMEALIASYE
jgi:multiple sugar transport system substrate-binding protein